MRKRASVKSLWARHCTAVLMCTFNGWQPFMGQSNSLWP
uniref:Uncharacterized protein n=1 Tax=Anguilla anguilla TaxID=7936 RepID=A0A0E9TLX5_ANGAN